MRYQYMTQNTCSQFIGFDIEGDVIRNIEFFGGCDGNLKAIAKLLDGWTVEQIEEKLSGNLCGRRPTSCADQLAKAVREAYEHTERMNGMKEVYEFLKQCGVYYLATVEGDQPRVRPFGTIDLFEDKLYIQTGKVKPVADQMKANCKVELSAMTPDGKWIRVAAEAVLDDNVEAQAHMLDNYPSLKAQYQPGDGNTEVYYLQNATAQICSFTEPAKTVTF